MFTKANRKKDDAAKAAKPAAPDPQPAPKASMAASAPKKAAPVKPSGVPSIISSDVVVHGSIVSQGEVQLDGLLDGDVQASVLIIGEKASVNGEVVCDNVTVRGSVEGGIRARSVTLSSTASIRGDIIHSTLQVETGAHFEGNCRHSDDPLSENSIIDTRRAAAKRPAPAPKPDIHGEDAGEERADAASDALRSLRSGASAQQPADAPASTFLGGGGGGRSPLR